MKKIILSLLLIFLHAVFLFGQSGTLDFTFDPGTGADNAVNGVCLQSDSKIIIVGDFINYNGTARNHIARLNTDGSLDTTFHTGTGANSYCVSAAVQNDGKILIGGSFTSYNDTLINRIARLNTDGSLDTSFHCGNGASDDVNSIAVQSDGKIVIGGVFYSYDNHFSFGIVRINSDGTFDSTFVTGQGSSGSVINVVLQNDGKMIVVGQFLEYNGISSRNIVRVNTDGSIDSTFNVGDGAVAPNFDLVFTAAVQSDGHILIGGFFDSYYSNSIPRKNIARLYDDGFIDISFDPGSGTDNGISTIVIQNDSKIIIGGNFTLYDSISRNGIARLNFDGSLDSTFDPGTGVGAHFAVHAGTLQTDQKIIIGGTFLDYNGTTRNNIARLENSTVGIGEVNSATNVITIYPNPITSASVIRFSKSFKNAQVVLYDMCGKMIIKKNIEGNEIPLDNAKLKSGIYLLQIIDNSNTYCSKITIE